MYTSSYYKSHTNHYESKRLSDIQSFAWIKSQLNIQKGEIILDAGSGTGYLLDFITPKNVTGYGIDISPDAISQAKKEYPHLHFSKGDLTNLPFTNNYFDAIYSFNVIEHIKNQDKVMKEMVRVLKPGGRLVIGTNIKDSLSWKLFCLMYGGDTTHVKEFTASEFVSFVSTYIPVQKYAKTSCIGRFHPIVNSIFQTLLRGDIVVKSLKPA